MKKHDKRYIMKIKSGAVGWKHNIVGAYDENEER